MATPRVSENPEVQAHYATQTGLTAALLAALRRLWPSVDPRASAASRKPAVAASAAVVNHFSNASISLSADFYEAMRQDAGVTSRFTVPSIDPLTEQQAEAYLTTSINSFLAQVKIDQKAMRAEVDQKLAEIEQQFMLQVEAAAQKIVADAGRHEIIFATHADSEAHGWARVCKPGACAFCLMLAARGPVYRSKETASFRAHVPKDGRGGFCQCIPEPLFGKHYEAPAQVRAAHALWLDSTAGHSGKAAIRAFRRAVDAQRSV